MELEELKDEVKEVLDGRSNTEVEAAYIIAQSNLAIAESNREIVKSNLMIAEAQRSVATAIEAAGNTIYKALCHVSNSLDRMS